ATIVTLVQRRCCAPLATVLPIGGCPCSTRRCPWWVDGRCCPQWADERRCPKAAAPAGTVLASASLAGGRCLCPKATLLWELTLCELVAGEYCPLRAGRRLPWPLTAAPVVAYPWLAALVEGLTMADLPLSLLPSL
ncbi:hypothetical protein GW17_00029092, partial [Ensete ventricosum]